MHLEALNTNIFAVFESLGYKYQTTSTNKLMLIWFILFPLITLTQVYATQNGFKENAERSFVQTITNTVQEGEEVILFVYLPSIDNKSTDWRLIFDNIEAPLEKGLIGPKPSSFERRILLKNEGVYSFILILLDREGNILEKSTTQVEVKANSWDKLLGMSWGPLLGAFIAMTIFFLQDYVRSFLQKSRDRQQLSARIKSFLRNFRGWDRNFAHLPELPDWMIDSSSRDWSIHIESEPFASVMRDIIEVRVQAFGGHYENRNEEFQNKFNEIEARLPRVRFSKI